MYCSCPYAAGGNNCKHMAAVLYEWTADIMDEDEPEDTDNEDMDNDADAESMDLFEPAVTVCDYKKNQLLWKTGDICRKGYCASISCVCLGRR